MTSTEQATPGYAVEPPRKSRKWVWIIGGVILGAVVLGTCVKGVVTGFSALSERSDATVALVEEFLNDGIPGEGDPTYSRRANVKDEAVDNLQRLVTLYGPVSDVEGGLCNVVTRSGVGNGPNGTFATCEVTFETESSPGMASIVWTREDETWKVYSFSVHYTDQTLLLDKAEKGAEMDTEEEAETASGD